MCGSQVVKVSRRNFIKAAGSAGAAAGLGDPAVLASPVSWFAQRPRSNASTKSFTGKRPEDYRIILQDIADPLTRMPWPPTPEKLVEASIGPLRGSSVNAYAFGLNHSGTQITHCSDTFPVVGQDQVLLRSGSALKMNEAVKRLCREGHNPLAIMCDAAHQTGMDFFLRMRMNDLHDRVGDISSIEKPGLSAKTSAPEPFYYTPKWKRDHPEWLIGDAKAPHPHASLRFWEAKAGNYVIAGFREMMLRFAEEALNQCDLDGFEIDFVRWPFLFPHIEAYAHRHIMTAVMRRIRKHAAERAQSRGRSLFLSARVPCSVELALRIGIDIPTWLKEGLLDLVVIGGGYVPFGTPWTEIGRLASSAGIPALACLSRGKFPQGAANPPEREFLRAAAFRAYEAGMSGMVLWNYFYEMEQYYARPGESRGFEFVRDLASRDFLRTARKSYALDTIVPEPVYFAYAHSNSPAQVPLMVGATNDGIGSTVVFDISDDLSRAPSRLQPKLWLHLVNLGPEDRLEFFWNGQRVHPDPKAYPGNTMFDHHEFAFGLAAGQVHRGENQLEIRLLNRSPLLDPYITLVEGHITIPEMTA